MSSGIASLLKILKDNNRRRIVIELEDKGSLSYVDLMKSAGIESTGKMNYHLRLLNVLVTKNGSGHYQLTEKGKLASKLLREFPTEVGVKEEKRVWIIASALSIVYALIVLGLYLYRFISFSDLLLNIFAVLSAVVLGYFAYRTRVKRGTLSYKRQTYGRMFSYVAVGAVIGMVAVFFGGALLLVGLVKLLQSFGVTVYFFSFAMWAVISPIFGALIGGFLGYLIFNRRQQSFGS